jgi:hypothetical protein
MDESVATIATTMPVIANTSFVFNRMIVRRD